MVKTNSPTGHRCDCSGYACACLGLPTPGENTVTLVTEGHVYLIDWQDLLPGDLVGKMGPGTEGANGHVAIVTGIAALHFTVIEQSGPTGVAGPTTRTIRYDKVPAGYKPYRSKYIVNGDSDMPLYGKLDSDPSVYCSNGVEYRPVSFMSSVVGGEAAIRSFPTLAQMQDYLGRPYTAPNAGSGLVPHVHDVLGSTGGATPT